MRGITRLLFVSFACACGTGDTRLDPGDLELRDLLGIAPDVANHWDDEQRSAARRVIVAGLDDHADAVRVELSRGATLDDQIARSLATVDARRSAAGDDALAVVRVELAAIDVIASGHAAPTVSAAASGTSPPPVALELSDQWGPLSARGLDVLSAFAIDAGHRDGAIAVTPVGRLAAIAAYTSGTPGSPARLVVNPVALAALDPQAGDVVMTTGTGRGAAAGEPPAVALRQANEPTGQPTREPRDGVRPIAAANGNPYSFYGSVAECAYAQRLRCESCLANGFCEPVTDTNDGTAECTTLAAGSGRGYFLLCINLSLAISSVEECTGERVGCSRVTDAASDLGQLEANASFLDDQTCAEGLDSCLAKIYGAPGSTYPGLIDAGTGMPPPEPPRRTVLDCDDSCSNNNSNCEASPNCDCSGPSCNNSLSCDSTCASSNDQSGCGDTCNSCESDSDSSGGSCGSCDSNSTSSGGGSSCGSCESSGGTSGGSSGGGCNSCGSSSGGGDSCGGGGCSGGSGGGGCNSGGGGCQVTKRAPSAGLAAAISVMWALSPLPIAALVKRRARRRRNGADDAAGGNSAREVAP